MKARSIAIAAAVLAAASLNLKASAGPNDFFGSGMPVGGSPDTTQGAQNVVNGGSVMQGLAGAPPGASAPNTQSPPGEYSGDEKRVQRKFKDNVHHAQDLIARGEDMMKSHDDKKAKKGKVLKEIGEKALADLKANDPFPVPEVASKGQKTH